MVKKLVTLKPDIPDKISIKDILDILVSFHNKNNVDDLIIPGSTCCYNFSSKASFQFELTFTEVSDNEEDPNSSDSLHSSSSVLAEQAIEEVFQSYDFTEYGAQYLFGLFFITRFGYKIPILGYLSNTPCITSQTLYEVLAESDTYKEVIETQRAIYYN